MRVYQGKLFLNTSHAQAKDEVITLSTSGGFRTGSTAVITGQFSQKPDGTMKCNYAYLGTITKRDASWIEIFVGEDLLFHFKGTVRHDHISLNMFKESDAWENHGRAEMDLVHSET